MQYKKFVKIVEPQGRWSQWFYLRESGGITEEAALEQVKGSQMNWSHEHLQLREQLCKAMETREFHRLWIVMYNITQYRPDGVWEERKGAGVKVMKGKKFCIPD